MPLINMDEKTVKKSAFSLYILLWSAYACVYVGRKNFSACLPGMISSGAVDKLAGGTIGSAFLAVYACGQLVMGLLSDKIHPKYMISCGLVGAGLMNVLMGINGIGALFPVIWAMNGLFCSMLWAPVVRCMAGWLPDEFRSMGGAAISATLPAGSIISYLLCALMLWFSGWRLAFIASGAVLIVCSAVFFIGMSRLSGYTSYMSEVKERQIEKKKPGDGKKSGSLASAFIFIASNGLLFTIGGICANGMLKDGLDIWIPTFLSEYFGLSGSLSSALTTVLPVVNILGAFLARRLLDRALHNEMAVCAVLFGVSAASFIPLIVINSLGVSGLFWAVVSAVLISVTTASMLGVNTMLLTFIPFHFASEGKSSSVSGFLNACSYAAAAVSGTLFGLVSSASGWSATVVTFALCSVLGAALC